MKPLFADAELQKALSNPDILSQVAELVQKAAVTNSTYEFSPDTRSIFNAENLDPVIKLIVPTSTPVRNIFPRVTGAGQAAAWKKLTSKLDPSASGSGTTPFFADAGSPSETTQTYVVSSAAYKLLGRKVEIGLQAVASSKTGLPQEDAQVKIKTLETMLGEEWAILNGDSAADSNAFDGLAKQITTNSGTAALLTASGVNVFAKTLYDNGGGATHLILNSRQNNALADELQASGSIQRIIVGDQGGAIGNVRVTEIVDSNTGGLIKLVTSRYSGSWAYLLSIKSPAGENWIEMDDLIPMIKLDVPNTAFAITRFIVESTVNLAANKLKSLFEKSVNSVETLFNRIIPSQAII